MGSMSPVLVECNPITSLFKSPVSASVQLPVTTGIFARWANMAKVAVTSIDVRVKVGGRDPYTRHFTDTLAPGSMGTRTATFTTPVPGEDPVECHVTDITFADGTSYHSK